MADCASNWYKYGRKSKLTSTAKTLRDPAIFHWITDRHYTNVTSSVAGAIEDRSTMLHAPAQARVGIESDFQRWHGSNELEDDDN